MGLTALGELDLIIEALYSKVSIDGESRYLHTSDMDTALTGIRGIIVALQEKLDGEQTENMDLSWELAVIEESKKWDSTVETLIT